MWTRNPVSGVTFDNAGIPQSYEQLYAKFGDPDASDFENEYLITVTHAFASGPVTFRCHKAMATALHDVWQYLTDNGLIHLLETFDGCYNNRPVRGGTAKSLHSWGLALDVNAALFPLGSKNRQNHELTVAFEMFGFWYGGDYHSRPDPMHYQYAGDI